MFLHKPVKHTYHIYKNLNYQNRFNTQLYSYLNDKNILKCSRSYTTEDRLLPDSAKIVVGGGGLIGCSLAYHLTQYGWNNIILLEKGICGSGTTWMGTGIVESLCTTDTEAAITIESLKFYNQLHDDGNNIGLRKTGSLNLARTVDRMTSFKRNLAIAKDDVKAQFMTNDDIASMIPLLHTQDILGALWIPDDIVVDPMKLLTILLNKINEQGVQVFENCEINRVNGKAGNVASIETNKGLINCDIFVNCTGQWARELGKLAEPNVVKVPVHSCQISELLTERLTTNDISTMPVIRDYDGYIYIREFDGSLLCGGFPPIAKPVFHEGIPDDFHNKLLPADWDDFQILLQQFLLRMPIGGQIKAKQLKTGAESFTPDGKPIMGHVSELKNYYVAAGMNCAGSALAGGMGKYLAEWITNLRPSRNLWSFDVQRFVGLHNNRKFLKDRVSESVSLVARIPYWEADTIGWDSGRRLRTSAIFTRCEPYAVFGQIMGYERPLYFHTVSSIGEDEAHWSAPKASSSIHGVYKGAVNETGLPQRGTFGKPNWFDRVKAEYWACREGVCIVDMSTFLKFELQSAGNEVVDFLQHICSNDVDKSVGSVIHTGMQNEHGGYENDCSVIRLSNNKYFLVGPTGQQTRLFHYLKDRLPKDGSVQLTDVTSMYTALNIIGPKSSELLSELTDASMTKKDFMHMTCKEINFAMASHVRAMRLTHTGEDGFMLYVPSEFGLHIYDSLQINGRNYGLQSAGYYALRTIRTEKFFAYWGTDLNPFVTPFECGREFRVKMETGGFIGYPALKEQKLKGVRKRLVLLMLEDCNVNRDGWPWGGEAIYRNGVYCGHTTSAAYGFGFEKHICLGYIKNIDKVTNEANIITTDYLLKNAKYEVNIGGQIFAAKLHLYAPVFPTRNTVPLNSIKQR